MTKEAKEVLGKLSEDWRGLTAGALPQDMPVFVRAQMEELRAALAPLLGR